MLTEWVWNLPHIKKTGYGVKTARYFILMDLHINSVGVDLALTPVMWNGFGGSVAFWSPDFTCYIVGAWVGITQNGLQRIFKNRLIIEFYAFSWNIEWTISS